MASAFLMDSDREAGAAMLASNTRTVKPRAAGLVAAGPELALPPGFSYHTFGAFGSAMTDGYITPPIHDGMATFDMGDGTWRIVRNHELGEGNDIPAGTVIGNPATAWDTRAPGGTTTLEIDATTGELLSSWILAQRDRHELRRHADAVGHLAHVRGDGGRQGVGTQQAARLRVRGRPGERRGRADEALQEAGAVPARGGRGRSRPPASCT